MGQFELLVSGGVGASMLAYHEAKRAREKQKEDREIVVRARKEKRELVLG